ncbi:uncharacterized protein PHACADRAFT_171110 [Phanerochaete carnosa HHB-10118-sp]|uniref:Store-operated calcium entry-associated regulatory factor n=1 Tax=Phanerochaete carnosa (strain HHB-10118-sp) TaxID=650164 RepID=K5WFP3_PHACS|nr:uncharacterized protein PHACADRAFT_171110 [Phanerochaete carnosa HHB-10118-sp]EKM57889.1 hypothetical protein PHACADRAFT_171110 [Phanerochaete carnosa HHB-10118-sp]
MSRIRLDRIKSLSFYKDALTAARRTDPLPQLTCIGKACRQYTPEAVRCVNVGGEATGVDWKCEADLPEALRFGRVEVSCEGWDGPGDPYVLKGSCALEYRLIQVPNSLRGEEAHNLPPRPWAWLKDQDPIALLFTLVWIAVFAYILWQIIKSCFRRQPDTAARPPGTGPQRPTHGSGWFSGSQPNDNRNDPPPPYTKHPQSSAQGPAVGDWRPGFWTGAALAGTGGYLLASAGRRDPPTATAYDWERAHMPRASPMAMPDYTGYTMSRRSFFNSDGRGEGSSSLGSMRRSTGLGGSSVR